MKSVASQVHIPWLAVGDFNNMVNSTEKFGKGDFDYHQAKLFVKNIHACGLVDLGWNGNPFTWLGKRKN